MRDTHTQQSVTPQTGVIAVFLTFLRLGLTSFGGPVAHLGYFREAFVVQRRWLDEAAFADLLALCQFLPGPASSQAGFAIGLSRAGLAGAFAAWLGFTMPSAVALFLFAEATDSLNGPVMEAALHRLKIVAVAVVAQAVWGMARTLTPDVRRAAIALLGAAIVLLLPGAFAQIAAIAAGAVLGLMVCRAVAGATGGDLLMPVSRSLGVASLVLYALLLVLVLAVAPFAESPALRLFAAFYRSGALVFGGGHVVLPLLKATVVDTGLVSATKFLAGYGAAQAVPGPLFTVSAYLGAVAKTPPNGAAGAAIALVAIFLPGMLILLGTLPFWNTLRRRRDAQALMRGVNAAVVGILAAALYNPLWTSAIASWRDAALALAGFALLTFAKWPPIAIVAGTTVVVVAAMVLF
jgi:chromate transporter